MSTLKTNITRSEKSVNVFSHSFNAHVIFDHYNDWTVTPATITIRNTLSGTEKKITIDTNYWDVKDIFEKESELMIEKNIKMLSKAVAKEIEKEIVLFLRSEI